MSVYVSYCTGYVFALHFVVVLCYRMCVLWGYWQWGCWCCGERGLLMGLLGERVGFHLRDESHLLPLVGLVQRLFPDCSVSDDGGFYGVPAISVFFPPGTYKYKLDLLDQEAYKLCDRLSGGGTS